MGAHGQEDELDEDTMPEEDDSQAIEDPATPADPKSTDPPAETPSEPPAEQVQEPATDDLGPMRHMILNRFCEGKMMMDEDDAGCDGPVSGV